MNFRIFIIPLLTIIGCAVEGQPIDNKELKLQWEEAPSDVERGERHFKFTLKNVSSNPIVLDNWVPQRGKPRNNTPPVILYAALLGDKEKSCSMSASFPVGQTPAVKSIITAGEVRKIDAVVNCSLKDGRYYVWAQLRGRKAVISEKVEIIVKGGVAAKPRSK